MNLLIQAIKNNNQNRLKLLLDLGHDPNIGIFVDEFQREKKTPLWVAFQKEYIECTKNLLGEGAEP